MEITDFPTDTLNVVSKLKSTLVHAVNSASWDNRRKTWLTALLLKAKQAISNGWSIHVHSWGHNSESLATISLIRELTNATYTAASKLSSDRPAIAAIVSSALDQIVDNNSSLVLVDTFTDIDGTILSEHTPDWNTAGLPWTKDFTYNLEIANNKLSYKDVTDDNNDIFKDNDHYIDIDSTTKIIEVDMSIVRSDSGINLALLPRYVDPNNQVSVIWQYLSGLNIITVRSHTASEAGTQIGSLALPINPEDGSEHTLRVEDNGAQLIITFMGNTTTVDTTTHNTSTLLGLKTNDHNDVLWDNIKVWV